MKFFNIHNIIYISLCKYKNNIIYFIIKTVMQKGCEKVEKETLSFKILKKIIEIKKDDTAFLENLFKLLSPITGFSENGKWHCKWELLKWKKDINKPDEIVKIAESEVVLGNIILDRGVEELWKIFGGIAGATPFSGANAVIGVGRISTPESATQTGLQDTNAFYKRVEATYPQVTARSIVYQTTFTDTEANFAWNEFAIQNGTGANAVALNRRVESLGTKVKGNWTLRATISLT